MGWPSAITAGRAMVYVPASTVRTQRISNPSMNQHYFHNEANWITWFLQRFAPCHGGGVIYQNSGQRWIRTGHVNPGNKQSSIEATDGSTVEVVGRPNVTIACLSSHIKKSLNYQDVSLVLWTDFTVTLTWLSSHPSLWIFVRNRVSSIQDAVPSASWRFIPGKENPADCATRGLQAEQLLHYQLWWTGPEWLMKTSSK